jgi:membrane protein
VNVAAAAEWRGRAGRLPGVSTLLAVHRRYTEIDGDRLSAALTFQAFLAMFPLMLVVVSVVGYIASSGVDIADRVVAELGLSGTGASIVTDAVSTASESRRAASIVGLVGLLWSGLALVGALQHSMNRAWGVNDESTIKARLIGLVWLGGLGVMLLATAALTTVVRWLPGPLAALGVVVAFAIDLALWLWTMRVLPRVRMAWRCLLPGAVVGAIGLETLKLVGAYYVPRAVASSSELFGSLGVVFAILAWLYLFSRLFLYAGVFNAVRLEHSNDPACPPVRSYAHG